MTYQPTMFEVGVTTRSDTSFENPRQAVIDATLDKAHEEWKAAYERYILTFASVAHEPFSAVILLVCVVTLGYLSEWKWIF